MQQEQAATGDFAISGRHFVWREIRHTAACSIEVLSGSFVVRIGVTGKHPANVFLGPMIVLGSEFPLGQTAIDPPFLLSMRSYDRDRHNLIHSESVKSVIQRFCAAKRHEQRPLTAGWRRTYDLPVNEWPESAEERSDREAAERAREAKLAIVAEKDARITGRRCPICGKPCPSYRVTCKHCGRDVHTAR